MAAGYIQYPFQEVVVGSVQDMPRIRQNTIEKCGFHDSHWWPGASSVRRVEFFPSVQYCLLPY